MRQAEILIINNTHPPALPARPVWVSAGYTSQEFVLLDSEAVVAPVKPPCGLGER